MGQSMSIWSFFTGNKKQQSKHPNGVECDDHFFYIKSLDYFGNYRISTSKEWIVTWIDSDRSRGVGGYRDKGNGRFTLYNVQRNEICIDLDLERPNNGHVSDNGFCCIEDWLLGEGLKGNFYVFSPNGKIIVNRRFSANIYNNDISCSGTLAVCQTANAKHFDGNKLTAFDLFSEQELFSVIPASGWATQYEFDEAAKQIIVVHKGIGKYRYSSDGVFLDPKRFEKDKLSSEDYVAIVLTIEERLKEPDLSIEDLNLLLESILKAKKIIPIDSNGWGNNALKLEGLILEKLGKYLEACDAYEKVLKLNPKIGVARNLKSLRKKLANNLVQRTN